MSSQLSAHAITAHTAITRIAVRRCSTLPAHRGSARAEKGSTSFSADFAILPSSIKGEPAQPVSPSEPARPFHALPLGLNPGFTHQTYLSLKTGPQSALRSLTGLVLRWLSQGVGGAGRLRNHPKHRTADPYA